MNLVYCYDAYCGWCFGFSGVIKRIATSFKEIIPVDVLSGGMILPAKPVHISATAAYIRSAYKTVEETTGVKFGKDYLWHIENPEDSDWYPHSEKPAIALSIVKEINPQRALDFATSLQYALHAEGRDLTDDEAYRHLLADYQLPENDFYKKLHSPLYKEKAYRDFEMVKQLKVTGFPMLFLKKTAHEFIAISRGYTDYETVALRLNTVLYKIKEA